MRRLICTFVVRIWYEQVFSQRGSNRASAFMLNWIEIVDIFTTSLKLSVIKCIDVSIMFIIYHFLNWFSSWFCRTRGSNPRCLNSSWTCVRPSYPARLSDIWLFLLKKDVKEKTPALWEGFQMLGVSNTWAATWQNQQNECASSEDSDQPGHPPSLIRVFAVRVRKLGSSATHWCRCPGRSESSLGAHSFCWFCCVVAHIYFLWEEITSLCLSLQCIYSSTKKPHHLLRQILWNWILSLDLTSVSAAAEIWGMVYEPYQLNRSYCPYCNWG